MYYKNAFTGIFCHFYAMVFVQRYSNIYLCKKKKKIGKIVLNVLNFIL